MKFCKLISIILMLSVSLCACAGETGYEDINILKNTNITEKINVSEITYPENVIIYQTAYMGPFDAKTILDVFSDDEEIVEGEPYAQGIQYFLGENEDRIVYISDGGLSCFGELQENYRNGFLYFDSSWAHQWYDNMDELEQFKMSLRGMYFTEEEEELEETIQKAALQDTIESVQEVMSMFNLSSYQLQGAYSDESGDQSIMYWRQEIDNIPFASVEISNLVKQQKTDCYNSHLNYDADLNCRNSELKIETANGQITKWDFTDIVNIEKEMGNYQTVSPESVYGLVQKFYEQKDVSCNPILENVELQYLSILYGDSEQMLIYPVWVFEVQEDVYRKGESGAVKDTLWRFFVGDAITGEWFTGAGQLGLIQ